MKTRRRTVDSRSLLSDNESLDTLPSVSFVEPSTTTTSTTTSSTTATATSITATSVTTTSATADSSAIAILKSDVWQYFQRITFVSPLKAQCKICFEELATPNYATSSLKRHLAQRHKLQQFSSNQASRPRITSIKLSKGEKKQLDALAVNAIIKDSRAFGDFQKSGLKTFIDALKPGKIFLFSKR